MFISLIIFFDYGYITARQTLSGLSGLSLHLLKHCCSASILVALGQLTVEQCSLSFNLANDGSYLPLFIFHFFVNFSYLCQCFVALSVYLTDVFVSVCWIKSFQLLQTQLLALTFYFLSEFVEVVRFFLPFLLLDEQLESLCFFFGQLLLLPNLDQVNKIGVKVQRNSGFSICLPFSQK